MKPSSKKQKSTLRIAIIVSAVLALIVAAFFMFSSTNKSKPGQTVITKKDAISSKTIVKEDPAISKDSIKREWERELEQEREGYAKEQARFAKVLSEASDEELFIVLNYAIAQQYVPNKEIDPFHNMFVMVGHWQRSLMVYNNLSDRKDLLKKIYPDLKVLDEYVKWGWQSGTPYPDTIVSQKILNNVKQESRKMNSKLISKYFRTPLMRY